MRTQRSFKDCLEENRYKFPSYSEVEKFLCLSEEDGGRDTQGVKHLIECGEKVISMFSEEVI